MGRKIPAKKHRGVKDPEKQRTKRLAELALRTNIPPKDVDEQMVPKSLERVIKLKEAAKTNNILRRKQKKKKNALICVGLQQPKLNTNIKKARPEKTVPVFQQKPGESGQQFWHRVSKDTHAFLRETAFEQKYDVQVERNPETGIIQGLTKRKVDRYDIERLHVKHKNIRKKKTATKDSTILTKSEKRKLKLQLKKNKKKLEESDDEFERLQDKVTFGEVIHEPPRLKIKRKEVASEERKPKNLLLESLFKTHPKKNISDKVVDRSGKRKNLPVAERRRLEKQQSEIIAAYRQLKSQRSANK